MSAEPNAVPSGSDAPGGIDFAATIAAGAEAAEKAAQPAPESTPSPTSTTPAPETPAAPVTPPEDKFASVTAPTPELWRELLTERNTIKTEFESAKPLVEKVATLGGEQVVEAVEPYFRPLEGATDQERQVSALTNGKEMSTKLYQHDPLAHLGLAEAMFEQYKGAYFNWALQEQGIDPAKFQEFQEWQKNPQTVVSSYAPTGAFPELVVDYTDGAGKPVYKSVVLPDGTPLDPNDGVQKLTYTLARENWEGKQAKLKADADTARKTESEQQTAQQQAVATRVTEFLGARDTVLDTQLNDLKLDFGDAPVTEDEKALAINHVKGNLWITLEGDTQLRQLVEAARDDAARGALGRAASAAVEIDRRNLAHFNAVKAAEEKHWKEYYHYRTVAQKGAPVPPLISKVAPVSPSAAPKPATTADQLWADAVAGLPE